MNHTFSTLPYTCPQCGTALRLWVNEQNERRWVCDAQQVFYADEKGMVELLSERAQPMPTATHGSAASAFKGVAE